MENSATPSVCIVITCYNYAQYVGRAIRSALNQDYSNLHLLIINDGSTDNSSEVINQEIAGKENVKFIDNEFNSGVSKVFNIGRKYAVDNGFNFAIMLDADNEFYPDHISKLVKTAETESADVVYVNFHFIDDKGQVIRTHIYDEYIPRLLRVSNYMDLSSLIRTNFFAVVEFDESLKTYQDWDIMLQLETAGARFVRARDCFLRYFFHEDGNNHKIGDIKSLQQHFEMLHHIVGKTGDDHTSTFDALYHYAPLICKASNGYIELLDVVDNYNKVTAFNEDKIARLEEKVRELETSRSFRLGRLLTAPLRLFALRAR
ncbi:MAG: glycosyltransferase [Candidatus Ancillula sp.]|jgi:glycosyltransferase involved in cell wall biosynthesis|nr:glycosyltransferase [Candidatus Ancillula sp.]